MWVPADPARLGGQRSHRLRLPATPWSFVWDGWGIADDGQVYVNSYVWIMPFVDGHVVKGTAFYDSISFSALWTRLQP